ncbi:MAG: helix-turn-helix transcriptional regulator [Saprospiraceae bacterium]|nr:helix-turn-helix transcriptional regulator [Saprospiraceae bacterium]
MFDKLNGIAKILKIVSHPVRLEILEILEAEEPLTVSEIRERINSEIEQSMLSHHLIKMKDNGILTSYKQGKNSYYSLTDKTMMNIFDCIGICEVF